MPATVDAARPGRRGTTRRSRYFTVPGRRTAGGTACARRSPRARPRDARRRDLAPRRRRDARPAAPDRARRDRASCSGRSSRSACGSSGSACGRSTRSAATASAIAAGDLSRRVERAEERTEVGRLGLALNAMLAQIEASFRAQEASERKLRRFVADASHELRTPLAAVRAYAELYDRGAAERPDDLERSMRGISRESERMSVLVDDLLLLARLDEGRPLEREPVRARRGRRRGGRDGADRRSRNGPIELHAEPAVVVGDRDRLRQIVDNLLANVRAHTPPGTPASVSVDAPERHGGDRRRGLRARARRGAPRARLRALLPRRPLARPGERRRRPRPLRSSPRSPRRTAGPSRRRRGPARGTTIAIAAAARAPTERASPKGHSRLTGRSQSAGHARCMTRRSVRRRRGGRMPDPPRSTFPPPVPPARRRERDARTGAAPARDVVDAPPPNGRSRCSSSRPRSAAARALDLGRPPSPGGRGTAARGASAAPCGRASGQRGWSATTTCCSRSTTPCGCSTRTRSWSRRGPGRQSGGSRSTSSSASARGARARPAPSSSSVAACGAIAA